ncbi:hypothetical protein ACHAAC_09480 [Aeromicrobium sp. CF4.19]|uniref:hypothetical protein n=1 Tax=Aeromicrobium sp. CF4.19 TaxID=3373082 RepID=UPI003EE4CF84
MTRTMQLVLMAGLSAVALLAPQLGGDLVGQAVRLGCPAAVALLAVRRRRHEEQLGRVLVTAAGLVAAGQVLAIVLVRTSLVESSAPLPAFLLLFGIPVCVILCLTALVVEPAAPEHEESGHDASEHDRS